jgi:SAM-dependent methyltransferase
MNINEINQKLISFWNNQFEKLEAQVINKDDLSIDNPLDQGLKMLGDSCQNVLDFGCGSGYGLFLAALSGKQIKYGLGIDTSNNAIRFCQETSEKSNLKHLDFIVSDDAYLEKLEPASFDGVICSNVLDVVPYQTSERMIQRLDRILKPGGYFLLKINFYLTEEMIKRINMEALDHQSYAINGVLRGVNLSTDAWIERFKSYDVIKIDAYQRLEKGPKDRLLIFRKQ